MVQPVNTQDHNRQEVPLEIIVATVIQDHRAVLPGHNPRVEYRQVPIRGVLVVQLAVLQEAVPAPTPHHQEVVHPDRTLLHHEAVQEVRQEVHPQVEEAVVEVAVDRVADANKKRVSKIIYIKIKSLVTELTPMNGVSFT